MEQYPGAVSFTSRSQNQSKFRLLHYGYYSGYSQCISAKLNKLTTYYSFFSVKYEVCITDSDGTDRQYD